MYTASEHSRHVKERLEYLEGILKECEQKCKNCGMMYNHLFENKQDGFCNNAIRKDALKRLIARKKVQLCQD